MFRAALLAYKMRHLEEKDQEAIVKSLKDTDVIPWDIHDLKRADVPVVHSLELTEETPIHSKFRQMALRNNAIVKKEVVELLQAIVVSPESSAWSFSMFIAIKRMEGLTFALNTVSST